MSLTWYEEKIKLKYLLPGGEGRLSPLLCQKLLKRRMPSKDGLNLTLLYQIFLDIQTDFQ